MQLLARFISRVAFASRSRTSWFADTSRSEIAKSRTSPIRCEFTGCSPTRLLSKPESTKRPGLAIDGAAAASRHRGYGVVPGLDTTVIVVDSLVRAARTFDTRRRIPNGPFTLKVSRKHAHEGRPAYGTGRGVGDRVMRRPSSRKACSKGRVYFIWPQNGATIKGAFWCRFGLRNMGVTHAGDDFHTPVRLAKPCHSGCRATARLATGLPR